MRKREKEDMPAEKKSVLLSSAVLSGILEVAKIVSVFCFNTPTQFPQMFGVAFQMDRFTPYECLRAYSLHYNCWYLRQISPVPLLKNYKGVINKKCCILYSALNCVISSPALQNIYMCLASLESRSRAFSMRDLHVAAPTSNQIITPSNPEEAEDASWKEHMSLATVYSSFRLYHPKLLIRRTLICCHAGAEPFT